MAIMVIVGCLCLSALMFFEGKDLNGRRVVRCLAAWMAGVGVGVLLIHFWSWRHEYSQKTYINPYLKYNIDLCRDKAKNLPPNIILVEGGSQAARGINYELLDSSLRERGYSTLVFQFSQPGANHFERLWELEEFFDRIGPNARAALRRRNLVLLRESSIDYDANPIAQFKENMYSDRPLAYLQLKYAMLAINAKISHDFELGLKKIDYRVIVDLLKHGLMNAFNIGLASRGSFFEKEPGYKPLYDLDGNAKSFRFSGISSLLQDVRTKATRAGRIGHWKKNFVDQRLLSLVKPRQVVYYLTPSLHVGDTAHLLKYGREFPTAHIISFADDAEFIRQFNDAACWYDFAHLQRKGSQLYTQWLAEKLSESGVLTR